VNPINFPLQPGMQGPAIADLQDALLLLIERQLIKTFPAPNRPTLGMQGEDVARVHQALPRSVPVSETADRVLGVGSVEVLKRCRWTST